VYIDVDHDGIKEIAVTPRLINQSYGIGQDVAIYKFEDHKYLYNQELSQKIGINGLITDIKAADMDGDGEDDIVWSDELNGIHILYQNDNGLIEGNKRYSPQHKGISFGVEIVDIDHDGDLDILTMNMGENNRLRSMTEDTLAIYVNDFDGNGQVEHIYTVHVAGQHYPINLRDDLVMQIPKIKKSVLKYGDYAEASIEKLIPADILNKSIVYQLSDFRSGALLNDNGVFNFKAFSDIAQRSQVFDIACLDIDEDGLLDLIIGGNQYEMKPEIGINAASHGLVLMNKGEGNFVPLKPSESGLFVRGEIRTILELPSQNDKAVIVFRNNDAALSYKLNK
jgi:hypothetical protein